MKIDLTLEITNYDKSPLTIGEYVQDTALKTVDYEDIVRNNDKNLNAEEMVVISKILQRQKSLLIIKPMTVRIALQNIVSRTEGVSEDKKLRIIAKVVPKLFNDKEELEIIDPDVKATLLKMVETNKTIGVVPRAFIHHMLENEGEAPW